MPYAYKKAYKPRSTRYSRYKRYNSVYNKGYGQGKSLAKKVQMLSNLINVEFKFNDTNSSGSIGDDGADIFLLNGMATGDDANSRDGRQIRVKSLQSNYVFTKHASATATNVRILWIIDTQPNEATATAANILQSVGMVAPRNLNYRKRFIILKDMNLKLNTDFPEKQVKFYKKLDMKTVFDSTGATIADITTNALYVLMLSDEAVNEPTVVRYDRIRFIDN